MTNGATYRFHNCRYVFALVLWVVAAALPAQTTTTVDPVGDFDSPTQFLGVPLGGPVAVDGDEITIEVPAFLLTGSVADWVAGSVDGSSAIQDLVPDSGLSTAIGSTVFDPESDAALSIQDVVAAGIFESSGPTSLVIELRELVDPVPSDTRLFFAVNYDGATPARSAGVFAWAPAHNFWGEFVNAIGTPFPYTPQSYYDIVSAEVEVQPTELIVRIAVAANVPMPPPETGGAVPYTPSYRITLDVDGDATTGDPLGNEELYTAFFDPSGVLQVARRQFNGNYFEIAAEGSASAGIVGDQITLNLPRSDFTLNEDEFSWSVHVELLVSEPTIVSRDDYWFSTIDSAPRSGPAFLFSDGFESGSTSAWE